MKSGLRKVHAATLAFHAYWFSELGPVFQSGFLPPVNAGFSRFLESGRILSQLDSAVSHEEAQGQTRPYDTHPSLRDRITALGVHPAGPGGDSRRAASLLADIPQREREVLEFVSRDLASLTRVEWEHVIDSVYVPLWRQRLAQHGYLLKAITVGAIPASRTDFVRLGSPLFTTDQSPSEDERVGRMGQLVVAAIALRLLSVGWKAETSPGDEIVLLHDGLELRPSSELSAILEGRATRDEWRARCLTMGIADLPLIAGGDPEAAQTGAPPAAGH